MKKILIVLLTCLMPSLAFAAAGDNFRPCQSVTFSVTSTSSEIAISACGAPTLNLDCVNTGTTPVFITGGTSSSVTASVPTGTPSAGNYNLGGGMDKVFDLGGSTYVAMIATSGNSATVYCSSGGGQ